MSAELNHPGSNERNRDDPSLNDKGTGDSIECFRMKILMIAPEPVFEPRGTPLSIVGRLKSLSDMNHRVDLLTYSIGKDVILPGVRIMRIPRIPGIRKIKIGPSIAKIPLDFALLIQSAIRLMREHYDLIHTHEEAGFWGTILARFFRIPHVYDMHSSLPQQLSNFRFSDSRILTGIFSSLEKWVLKYANCVITICPDLKFYVESLFPEKGSILIENVLDYADIFKEEDRTKEIRMSLHLDGKKVVLYTGTFEPYQGLELLIRSAAEVVRKNDSTVFLLVGGHPDQVSFYRDIVRKEGLENHFLFTGQVEPQDVNSYIRCADVLLSPRTAGTNTPLKIYGYLRSGVPIVATRLLTHTQVLDDHVAVLTEPVPESFANGILSVLTRRRFAEEISRRAVRLAKEKYNYSIYCKKLDQVLQTAVRQRI
jgi:glycosyltransferase involved in cell wall biosynthesis